jgi:hypothetical protein
MLIDHIAWKLPLAEPFAVFLHIIGRIAMPIFCYQIAEGFHYTRNKKKYAERLFIFAVISQLPYNYFERGSFLDFNGLPSINAIFTLFLGLICLMTVKSKFSVSRKILIIGMCCAFSLLCDWFIFAILWILIFGLFRDNFKKICKLYLFVTALLLVSTAIFSIFYKDFGILMQIGVLLPLPILARYNGEKSRSKTAKILTSKWLFYVFYPLHLVIIAFAVSVIK